jgi:hypothetical protein
MRRFQHSSGFCRRHALQGITAGLLAFSCVMALVLVELAISRHATSELISETMRTELGGLDRTGVTHPPRSARPMVATQTARAN